MNDPDCGWLVTHVKRVDQRAARRSDAEAMNLAAIAGRPSLWCMDRRRSAQFRRRGRNPGANNLILLISCDEDMLDFVSATFSDPGENRNHPLIAK